MSDSTRFLDAKLGGGLDSKLKLREFSGTEAVSSLFQFELAFVSEQPIARSEFESKLLGKPATVTVTTPSGKREFSGLISEVGAQASHNARVEYRAVMVPFLWYLSKSSDCRVFQNKTTIEIVKSVIDGCGEVVDNTGGSNVQNWEYCVQYRETDLNFVCRLLEQDGIFYYFQHEGGTHKLVLGNQNSHFLSKTGEPLDLLKGSLRDGSDLSEITSWRMDLSSVSGKWAHGDYNFTDAKTRLAGDAKSGQKVPNAQSMEVFDYPGEFLKQGDGDKFAKIRGEEIGVDQARYSGDGRTPHITAGKTFQLGENPNSDDAHKEFIAIRATHFCSADDFHTSGSGGATAYYNRFAAIPADCNFRPRRLTPKPAVNGLLSAVVVGPSGEEIYTDEYGRVKVRFHWDREQHDHDACSCFIRVAQLLAGREWGFMAVPRIGQEVLVDFIDGDPDRPLIVGGVYNSDQMPAYDPRQMASRIYLKSNSTKGGNGFNELMLDDKKDAERIFLHAQKDLDIRVRNDVRKRTYGNEHHIVGWEKDGQKGGSTYFRVLKDNQINVQNHQDEHVEGNYRLMVGNGSAAEGGMLSAIVEKQLAIQVGKDGIHMANAGDSVSQTDGSVSTTVKKDVKTKIDGGCHATIKGDHNEQAANLSIDLKQMANVKAGMKVAVEAGTEVHVKSGASMVIEAGAMLTMKVGGNFININPAGIFIQGTLVGINSGGAAGAGTGCMVMPPSPAAPLTSEPEEAAPMDPDQAHKEKTGYPSN